MKRSTALIAAAPSPGISSGVDATSQIGSPIVFAWPTIRACVVSPIPRRGELTTRWKATTSCGLTRKRQVAERVLDLGALVEARAADHLVADAVADERVLEHAALRVRAVEDGDLVARAAGVHEPLDLAGDVARLGVLVLELADARPGRPAPASVQSSLRFCARLFAITRVGGGEDRLRRAVVLLELDDLGVGEVVLEVEDVADVGAAEGVDRLLVVADHRQVAVLLGQDLQPAVLRAVRVLVLVHEHVLEVVLVALAHLREELEQVHACGRAGRRSPSRSSRAPAARRARRRRRRSARRTSRPSRGSRRRRAAGSWRPRSGA